MSRLLATWVAVNLLLAWLGWKLGHAAGILDGAEKMLDADRRVFGKLAAYIAWQERKLDQLGYDPATDPDLAPDDPATLAEEVERFLAEPEAGP